MDDTNIRQLKDMLPPRKERSNKGTYGRVLLMAGSYGMCGAAVLAARAAARSGCGLVGILSPSCNRLILQTAVPEALFLSSDGNEGHLFQEDHLFRGVRAAAFGPGIGTSKEACDLLMRLTHLAGDRKCPVVLDADALNLFAAHLREPQADSLFGGKRHIITPHPGEMARLTGLPVPEILNDPVPVAEQFAARHQLIVVLKDHHTIVTDGGRTVLNRTGNDGMATGGSGDVLTGIIVSLLAQGADSYDAAVLGVYIHGLAGDLAADEKGRRGMIASDIAAYLPEAFRRLEYA